MNQLNTLHGDEPTDPPRYWNSHPTAAHSKSRNSPPKTSPVVSSTMGIFNHHSIDNGDVEVHPSEFPLASNYESVPYPDNNLKIS